MTCGVPVRKIACPAKPGYNPILAHGAHSMALTEFGLLMLRAGATHEAVTGDFEEALVFLGGRARVIGDGFDLSEVGGRASVFDGPPHTVYLPRRIGYRVTATTDADIAVNRSPASRDTAPPTLIPPEKTRALTIGKDNYLRHATVILDETFDSEHFYIGEGHIPSGHWSGYPPHRHDVDDPPAEIDMEETYFYRFDPPHGFGFQGIYAGDNCADDAYLVRHNDTVAIASGYHPLCGAPGYRMYYLWTMTGAKHRGLISAKDPAHVWVG